VRRGATIPESRERADAIPEAVPLYERRWSIQLSEGDELERKRT